MTHTMARDTSYVRGAHGIEAKHYRPKNSGEARRLIKEIFAKQGTDGWDERSQAVFMRNKGIEPKPLEELDVDDLRVLVAALDKAHMVIFHD